MKRFRKLPVEVDAVQWDGTNFDEIKSLHTGGGYPPHMSPWNSLVIATKEGDMRAEIGDWIIRGTAGELYPCKPDIFAKIYEEVTP